MKSCKKIGGKYKMELLSIRETADIMGTKESTVRTWINRNLIPPVIVVRIGNTVRIKKDKFEKWVSDGSI